MVLRGNLEVSFAYRVAIVAATLLCLCPLVEARTHRRSSVRRAFLKAHHLTKTPTGCQVDHIVPLECGGKDEVANLWLTCGKLMEEKEKLERRRDCAGVAQWVKNHPGAGLK